MIKVIGRKDFGSKIDVTDPCYDRDVWCRMNDVQIEPGEYECYIDLLSDEETGGWGERVAAIGIRKDESDSYRPIGSIGVDAGLAGFFNHKPDFTDDEWVSFCDALGGFKKQAWFYADGFFSNSGYGDGGYNVYATGPDDAYTGLYIQFIGDDDDEEDEDDWEDDCDEDMEDD